MCLAVPGKILSTEEVPGGRAARVSFGGVVREARLDFVPDADVGDYVLVHVGFALNKIDEDEAHRILEDLRVVGELAELEENAAPPNP